MRRLRQHETLRRMVAETTLSVSHLVYPIFVTSEHQGRQEIAAMPGQYRTSIAESVNEARQAHSLGVPSVMMFGIPPSKDEQASQAIDPEGVIPRAVRRIKEAVPSLMVMTDVCIDEYTTHGHCGLVKDGRILNDETLEILGRMAVIHAEAGADMVAPSDMMDGRVGAIRHALDASGYTQVPILSYAAKYASCFYAPFREAVGVGIQFGDRRSYQMSLANRREALREVALDIEEGADIVMIKPALLCLDVIADVKARFSVPVAAYQVSGEYAMIRAAGRAGWIDEDRAILESLLSIRRAGADMIVTYFAKELPRLQETISL